MTISGQKFICGIRVKLKNMKMSEHHLNLHSVDPDEMQHYFASHLGLHCLQSNHLGVSLIQRVN